MKVRRFMRLARFTTRTVAPLTLVAATMVTATTAAPVAAQQSILKFSSRIADQRTVPLIELEEESPASAVQEGAETFTERYPDGSPHIQREVALDSEGNYVNHGQWKLMNQQGEVVAEGRYDMGQRVGVWTRWQDRNSSQLFTQSPFNRFKTPFLSQATFTDGKLDGEWIIFDANQLKVSQVSISNGQRHGMAILWAPDGKILRQATYNQGVPVGDVLQLDAQTGEPTKAATYLDGRQIVTKSSNFNRTNSRQPEARKTVAQYLAPKTVMTKPDDFWTSQFAEFEAQGDSLRHGPSKAWHPNGQIQLDGQYEHDKKVGHFTYWHPNGQKAAEGTFKNDVNEGTWVWWHENGQKAAVGHYQAGALIGRWRWWGEDGKLAKQKTYDSPQQITSSEEEHVEVGQLPVEELRF